MIGSDHHCPTCRGITRHQVEESGGFWQREVLAKLGWRPIRCVECGTRLYRRVEIGAAGESGDVWQGIAITRAEGPRIIPPGTQYLDPEFHGEYKHLIRQIRRAEKRAGLDVAERGDER